MAKEGNLISFWSATGNSLGRLPESPYLPFVSCTRTNEFQLKA